MRTGDPNGPDADGSPMPQWEPYTMDAPYGMLFGDQAEFRREPASEIMQFLVQHYFKKHRLYMD
jgi:para-nitrobenzyl esterase